ncbi:phage tail protein [Nocardia sp. 852002-20019_SCH5090214]|uniref:Gp37-like protein n=1 Tax=Nocardia sp. 852002-20019_SCH5090214 TaxID=1834087 RepID=UPI0007E97A50|nr:hypothetical protein [Nocardia sp. 852002-20019_SCH5090214]OBA62183.1 phage tail protein [Nocardia sp. 852002-20019_SCH5090214]
MAAWNDAAEARRMDALELADQAYRTDQTALVRYYDKFLQEVGEEGAYTSLEFSIKKNAAGGLKMSVPRADMVHFDHFFKNPDGADATIPITVTTAAYRWDGFVTRAALIRDENGVETVDIEAIHVWQVIAAIALWASPFAPFLAQFPRHMVLAAPLQSLIAIYLACNLIRLQMPLWSLPANWLDAPEWAQTGALWPIALVPVWIPTDTSVWRAASARFDMADQLFEPLLDGTGVMLTARFFLPEDGDEQPAPEYYYLDRPTVVIGTEDKSGSVGPSGTMFDGVVKFIEEFVDDTTLVRYPDFNAQSEYESVYGYSGPLGTFRGLPHVWYLEGEYSGIGESELAVHKPTATKVIVGGKSPGWVNAGIEIAMKNLLAWLGLLIGVPGLDSLYQGQLDDVFLAWWVWEDQERTQRAGPFAFNELVVTNSSKAATLDGVMAGRKGLHDSRGYVSKKVSVGDGAPYLIGKDFTLGDQIGFQVGDQLFTDYITEMTFTDDRQKGARWELQIGDGADDEDSMIKAWARMQKMAQAIHDISTDVGADLDLLIF